MQAMAQQSAHPQPPAAAAGAALANDPPAAASSSMLAGHAASVGAAGVQDRLWRYIDDFGRQQGPFPERSMKAWTQGGYFHAETLVRCVTPPQGVDLQAGLMPDQTCMLLPLQVLFPDPETAFNGLAAWVPAYNNAAQYQLMVKMATELGGDPTLAVEKAMYMQDNSLPPELPILLDILGMREVGSASGSTGASPGAQATAGASKTPAGSPQQPSGAASHAHTHSGLPHSSPLLGPGGPDAASAAAIAAL